MIIGYTGISWYSGPSKKDLKEKELYKNIVEILLKNKEKIKYVKSETINDNIHYYFKYKDKEIDICKYNWKESADKYNLTVDDILFLGSNSFSFEYLDLCEYLCKLGEDKHFDEIVKKSKKESTKIYNERIQKLKSVLKKLNE